MDTKKSVKDLEEYREAPQIEILKRSEDEEGHRVHREGDTERGHRKTLESELT